MNDFVNRFLQMDFNEVWIFLTDVLRSPTNNVAAFAMIMGALAIVTLVVVLLMVLAFVSGSDDEDEEWEYDEDGEPIGPVLVAAEVVELEPQEVIPLTPEQIQRERIKGYVSALVWTLVFAVVWIAGGVVTRADTVCVSCHGNAMHVARLTEKGKGDPHAKTECVSCHETPNIVASVTTAVPVRGVHFVGGYFKAAQAKNYGVPVANKHCAACHGEAIEGIATNEARGLRISHKEPLEARALCTDCHKPRPLTGVINSYTVGMRTCLRCHDERTASADCEVCHTKDVGLAVQSRGEFQPIRHAGELQCGGCHSQKTCDNCHGIRMPHTAEFMGVLHARPGVEDIWFNDGKTCGKCHTDTRRPCTKCHNKMPSHGLEYMETAHQKVDPNNNGCNQCHSQLSWVKGRNFCGVCHPKYNNRNQPLEQGGKK